MTSEEFNKLDSIAFKLENGLLRLIETLEQKRTEDWNDTLLIKEANDTYEK